VRSAEQTIQHFTAIETGTTTAIGASNGHQAPKASGPLLSPVDWPILLNMRDLQIIQMARERRESHLDSGEVNYSTILQSI
jgi:hypothetical protein